MIEDKEYWNNKNGLGVAIGEIKPGENVSLLINRKAELYGAENKDRHVSEQLITIIPEDPGLIYLLKSLESMPERHLPSGIEAIFNKLHSFWYDPSVGEGDEE